MMYHYKAFISYKHDPVDSEVAAEIQTRLERFHIPYALQKEKSVKTLRPVFRDKDELSATEDLNDTIKNALMETEFLIVICSTRSIKSIWVQKEIEFFLQHHDKSKVLTVLVDGEPTEVIPRVLCEKEVTTVDEDGNEKTVIEPLEPLSCDYRMERRIARREEFPRLAAALIGCRYNDLRQRQRQYQMRLMGAGIAVLTVLMLYFVWSNIQISKNLMQSQISQSRNLANMSTASLEANDRIEAAQYALEALPVEEDKPVIYEAAYALSQAVGAYDFPDTMDIESTVWMPARYEGRAIKVDDSGRFLVMQDGKNLLRFMDIETKEEIGEAESDERISLLSVMDGNVLLVGSGSRLCAYDMETAGELWSQTFEKKILGISVPEDPSMSVKPIILVFEDHVLAVNSQTRDILGSFDSGSDQTPFYFKPKHPYTYAIYYYGEDQDGSALYLDKEEQKLYVISRTEEDENVNGILVLDVRTMTADFHPMQVDCGVQYSLMADKSGIYLIGRGEYDDALNTVVTDASRRTAWIYQSEKHLLVMKVDPDGNVLWETPVTYTGTSMLGHTVLMSLSSDVLGSSTASSGILAAAFSNCLVLLNMDDGSILKTINTHDEIADINKQLGDHFLTAVTIEGNLCYFSLKKSTVSTYQTFKEDSDRMEMMRTEVYDNNITVFLQYGDGVRVYAMTRGDEEYTACTGEKISTTVCNCCLRGSKYGICQAGNEEVIILDLAENRSVLKTIDDLGLTRLIQIMYMDPEEKYFILYGANDAGNVFQKINLEDYTYESIAGPGMDDLKEYNYCTDPVCVGDQILYFATKAGVGTRNPYCLIIYNIPSGSWTIHELDIDMLNLIINPIVRQDGQAAVMVDQWENGYLINTKDGSMTPLHDKIPTWTFSVFNENGTAFAVCIEDAEKEQIAAFSADGTEQFRIGRDYIAPLSMTYHGKSLWVLYEDHEVYEYDGKTGAVLQSMSADVKRGALDEDFCWDFTEDGQLLLSMGNSVAQLDLELGGMMAEVPSAVGYIPSQDRMFVVNTENSEGDDRVFVSYPRYTVDDLIRKGKEIVE